MIETNIRAYTTAKSRRRLAIVLLLLFALLGVGVGGFPYGGEETQPVTVTAEEQNDEPIDLSDGDDETDDGSSGDQEGPDDNRQLSANEENTDTEGTDTEDSTETSSTTTENSQSGEQTASQLDIVVNKSEMSGQVDSVMPGDSGNVTLTVTNDGNRTGEFRVYTGNVTDYENGLTEPEADVDSSGSDPGEGAGELSTHLEVRWSLLNSTDRVYLTENDSNDDYVPIETLDNTLVQGGAIPENGSADALFEWRVPTATGNEIQGDAVEFDVEFTLVSE